MAMGTLGAALEREHRDIDGGIEAYTAGVADGTPDPSALRRSISGLRRHIYLEEAFLFPPLRASGMMMAIMVMLKEHGELWRSMDDLEKLLAEDADASSLVDSCTALLALLDKHNTKEEPIIYTQADTALPEDASARLQDFLAAGTIPDGWVCQGASQR